MTDEITTLQEQIAYLEKEVSQLSDELYAQQKDMAQLRLELVKLQQKLQASSSDSGILTSLEDSPPPHY